MKIVFNVNDVLAALQPMMQVVNKRNSMPILDNVLMSIDKESLTVSLTASDSDNELTTVAPILEADKSTEICTNAALLLQILSRLKNRVLTFETSEDSPSITGTYEEGSFDITFVKGSDYPRMHFDDEGIQKMVFENGKTIEDCIKNTSFAVCDDLLRPALSGICFDFSPQSFKCVGTDGRVLVKREDYTMQEYIKGEARFILPKKISNVLANLAANVTDEMHVMFTNSHVMFFDKSFTLSCRLIDSKYPNYESVIPQNSPNTARVNRETLRDSLSRMSVFSSDSELIVMEFSHEGIDVSCQDIDYSISAKEHIACEYNGDDVKVGFKYSLLDSVLNNLSSEDVIFKMTDGTKAVLVIPYTELPPEVEVVSLIMPMAI